ncbi:MAG: hypothetical protein ACI81P_003588 [Neolewinella sp.]|jgi:hypothetical protein
MKNRKTNQYQHILLLLPFLMLVMSFTSPNTDGVELDTNGDGTINILVIGTNNSINGGEAFSPNQIAAELQNILSADPAISLGVNVVAEDIYRSELVTFGLGGGGTEYTITFYSHSLAQYYYWPEGLDARMDNLSGNGGVDWDHVVIGADPHIISTTPGYYSLGVNKVAAKVAEGGAQPHLLMMWPKSESSEPSITHFEEFTYRTADGAKVALSAIPAGLAWEALPADKKDIASVHPTPNGAYVTAATIYSHICGTNASSSAYVYDNDLADVALSTVTTELNEVHYSGPRTFLSPFKSCDVNDQVINYNQTGSSSEAGIRGGLNWVFDQAPETLQNGGTSPINFNYGRANSNFEPSKRYNINPALFDFSFGFPMQDHGNHGNVSMLYGLDKRNFGTINDTDLGTARFMVQQAELPYARAIPIRTLFAQMREVTPTQSAYRDSWHMHRDLDKAIGGYMYTLLTGNCAVGVEPTDQNSAEWRTWMAHKIGYETAWTLMYLDGTPPCGLVSLPIELLSFTVSPKKNKTAVLKWITATEEQNEGFHIERSSASMHWNDVGFMPGQGTSLEQQAYQFEDENIEPGLYYYRLRQVDLDGAYTYSPVRSIAITSIANPFSIRVFPNPVDRGNLTVTISDSEEREGEVQIIDMLGRVVQQQLFNNANFRISTDKLSPGTYWLMISMDGNSRHQKIIVTK